MKSIAELNAFNNMIAEFGLLDALEEMMKQCRHFADVAEDNDRPGDGDSWLELRGYLEWGSEIVIDNGLSWPKKPTQS